MEERRDELSRGQLAIIVLTQYANLFLIFLFLARIKLAEIQLTANQQQINIKEILARIKWFMKFYRISYFVIFGFLS